MMLMMLDVGCLRVFEWDGMVGFDVWPQEQARVHTYQSDTADDVRKRGEDGQCKVIFVDMADNQVFADKRGRDGEAHKAERRKQEYQRKSFIFVVMAVVLIEREIVGLAATEILQTDIAQNSRRYGTTQE